MVRRLTLALLLVCGSAAAQAPPSFLIVLADDLGRDAVGYTGAHPDPPSTPRIDQFAAEGIRFRRAYVSPVCSPTRGMVLTGRYPWRTGLGANIQTTHWGGGLDLGEDTLPHALGPAWRRVVLGKWHVSHAAQLPADPPGAFGYDDFRGSWFNLNPWGQTYWRWLKTEGVTTFGQDLYATTDSIDGAIHELRTGTEPLLLMVNVHAPHSPFHVAPAHLAAPPDTLQTPDLFATMVEALDTEFGRLLDELDSSAYADSTWVIFLGDNGTPGVAVEPPWRPDKVKDSVYEGGIRVPLIVRGPGTAPADVEGLVVATDLYATITELAGAPATTPDSISFVPYLRGHGESLREYAYSETFGPFYANPPNYWKRAVVGPRYKLIEYKGPPAEMYDLLLDPEENRDLLELGPDGLSGEQRRAYWWLRERMDAQGGGLFD